MFGRVVVVKDVSKLNLTKLIHVSDVCECSWVQTGIWNGDAGNVCRTHHELGGSNPGWGSGDAGVAAAGYMDWVMCCGGQMGGGTAGSGH